MYVLINTFNDVLVSRHRSLVAALKADAKLQRSLNKGPGGGNRYIPTKIASTKGEISLEEWNAALDYIYEEEMRKEALR